MKSLDMEMEKGQLDPEEYGKTRLAETDSHARLQETITASTVGRWRDDLSGEEVERTERTLRGKMMSLGYSVSYVDE